MPEMEELARALRVKNPQESMLRLSEVTLPRPCHLQHRALLLLLLAGFVNTRIHVTRIWQHTQDT